MKELLQQLLGICFDKKLIMDLNADIGCVIKKVEEYQV